MRINALRGLCFVFITVQAMQTHFGYRGIPLRLRKFTHRLGGVEGAYPVFAGLLTSLRNGDIGNMRGHLFELEVASRLQSEGHTIIALGCHPCPLISCEFDIMTDDGLCIECKSMSMKNWKSTRDAREQLVAQQQIVALLRKRFIVYFDKAILPRMGRWLAARGINYVIMPR